MFHRHRSIFPLIIAGLTIALVVFMVYSFSNRQTEVSEDSTTQIAPAAPKVTAEDYRKSIREVVTPFANDLASQENDLGRLGVVERTLSDVLEQRVPTEFRDFHLKLAFSFSRMGEDLRGESEGDPTANFTQDLAEYQALVASTPWLQ